MLGDADVQKSRSWRFAIERLAFALWKSLLQPRDTLISFRFPLEFAPHGQSMTRTRRSLSRKLALLFNEVLAFRRAGYPIAFFAVEKSFSHHTGDRYKADANS